MTEQIPTMVTLSAPLAGWLAFLLTVVITVLVSAIVLVKRS